MAKTVFEIKSQSYLAHLHVRKYTVKLNGGWFSPMLCGILFLKHFKMHLSGFLILCPLPAVCAFLFQRFCLICWKCWKPICFHGSKLASVFHFLIIIIIIKEYPSADATLKTSKQNTVFITFYMRKRVSSFSCLSSDHNPNIFKSRVLGH